MKVSISTRSATAPEGASLGVAPARHVGALFNLEDLGGRSLAGFAEPQRAWRVIGESGAVSRFEALRSDATPLVGRDEELELALRRWQQAKTGEGRVLLVSGEPGIGKSRLTAALSDAIGGDLHTRLRWFCSPYHQDSALYPVTSQIEAAAGFARGDDAAQRLDKARRVLVAGGDSDSDGDFELLAELLSLPNTAAERNLSPQRKRELLFEALLGQLVELARHKPVLAIFEDVHWIDPTSRELLDLMVERVRCLRVLLVITFRPEFQVPWGGQSHVTNLALNRLGGREVGTLVLGIAGNAALGDEVVDAIIERTDGVPLFRMIAVLLILFVLPLMAVVALAIKLDSRGPVFSRTPRTDRGGRQINILRFRTSLSHPAGDRSRDTTRVGWFLWSTRIDGLPQLFNVVRGDMSLLGRDRPCPDL